MADVAREAGVAPMTVSNYFSQPEKVLAKKRERIEAAASKLGYLRNMMAGSLASGRSHVVGVAVPSVRNSNFAGVIQGLEDRLSSLGYQLMLSVCSTAEREFSAIQTFLQRRVDGIVLTGIDHDPRSVDVLKLSRTPVVETWNLSGPFIDMGVGFSLYDAAKDMVRYLISKGRSRIGFAGYAPAENPRFLERQRGWRDALEETGLIADLVSYCDEAKGFAAGGLAMNHLLEKDSRLDAVFCVTDVLAAGALFECARRGWAVPEKFAIAGYGDYEIAAELSPKLTTVRTPGYEMGSTAAQMIIDKFDNTLVTQSVKDVGYELIIRESS